MAAPKFAAFRPIDPALKVPAPRKPKGPIVPSMKVPTPKGPETPKSYMANGGAVRGGGVETKGKTKGKVV